MVTGKFWFEADYGVTLIASDQVHKMLDKTSSHNDVDGVVVGGTSRPLFASNIFGTLPAILSGNGQTPLNNGCLRNETADIFDPGDPRTVIAVLRPFGTGSCFVAGGGVCSFGVGASVHGFDMYLGTEACGGTAGQQYVQNNGNHGDPGTTPLFALTPVSYLNQTVLAVWQYNGSTVSFSINGVSIPMASSTPGTDDGDPGFLLMSSHHQSFSEFSGYMGGIMCHATATAPSDSVTYMAVKYGINMPISVEAPWQLNDVVRSAMFGLSLHQPPVATVIPS